MPRPARVVPEGTILVQVYVDRAAYLLFDYQCKLADKDTQKEFVKLVKFPELPKAK